jgi:hypothetical protein
VMRPAPTVPSPPVIKIFMVLGRIAGLTRIYVIKKRH